MHRAEAPAVQCDRAPGPGLGGTPLACLQLAHELQDLCLALQCIELIGLTSQHLFYALQCCLWLAGLQQQRRSRQQDLWIIPSSREPLCKAR